MSERDFGIDASAFRAAADALAEAGFEREAGKAISGAIRRSANAVRRGARAELRPHRRTGRTAARINVRYAGSGLRLEATVRSGGKSANLLAGGTRAHEITPVSSRALAIHAPGRAGGVVGFATAIEHPGTAAVPFFADGIARVVPEINGYLATAGDELADGLAHAMRAHR